MENIKLVPAFSLFSLHTSDLFCISLLTLQLFFHHFFSLIKDSASKSKYCIWMHLFFHNWRVWLDTVATKTYLEFVKPNPLSFFPLPPSSLHQHKVTRSHPALTLLEPVTSLPCVEWFRRVGCLWKRNGTLTENYKDTFAFNVRQERCSCSPPSALQVHCNTI